MTSHNETPSTPIATGPTLTTSSTTPEPPSMARKDVVGREKEAYGGIKAGSAFFGWLTATGVAVILIALLAAGGTAIAVATKTTPTDVANAANTASANTAETVGWAGGIALLVVLLLSYYCGGYVAGRMSRFQGLRQGIATWLWGVVITIIAAVFTALAGDKYNVLAQLNLPRIPIDEGNVTTAGAVAMLALAAVSLIGAMLGGLAGMRFHRKVDKAGLASNPPL